MEDGITKLRQILNRKEKNRVHQWWHSEFEMNEEYRISIPNFPGSGKTEVLKGRTRYLVFPGTITKRKTGDETKCDEIFFPESTFLRCIERSESKIGNEDQDISFIYQRLSNKIANLKLLKLENGQKEIETERSRERGK